MRLCTKTKDWRGLMFMYYVREAGSGPAAPRGEIYERMNEDAENLVDWNLKGFVTGIKVLFILEHKREGGERDELI